MDRRDYSAIEKQLQFDATYSKGIIKVSNVVKKPMNFKTKNIIIYKEFYLNDLLQERRKK